VSPVKTGVDPGSGVSKGVRCSTHCLQSVAVPLPHTSTSGHLVGSGDLAKDPAHCEPQALGSPLRFSALQFLLLQVWLLRFRRLHQAGVL